MVVPIDFDFNFGTFSFGQFIQHFLASSSKKFKNIFQHNDFIRYKLHNFDFTVGHFKSRICKKVFEFQSLYQQNNFFGTSIRT